MFRVIVGSVDITAHVDDLQWSCTDPGGFEAANFSLEGRPAEELVVGDPVTITYGVDLIWAGRIEDIDREGFTRNTSKIAVSCVGPGVLLKEAQRSMVYIDRSLSDYSDMALTRKVAYLAAGYNPQSVTAQVTRDDSDAPGIVSTTSGVYSKPIDHRVYDAGPGNAIARARVGSLALANLSSADTNLSIYVTASTDDTASSYEQTANLRTSSSVDYSPVSPRRFIFLEWASANTAGGSDGIDYGVEWIDISLIGDHGLPLRGDGTSSDGLYASEIARHAALSVAGIYPGEIEESTGYIVPHCVYKSMVSAEDIVSDMAKLLGWHWGVWADNNYVDMAPRFVFKRPPKEATHYVSTKEAEDAKLTSSLTNLYNVAVVEYETAAGDKGQVTVSRPIDILDQQGISRTVQLDIGLGSSDAATVYGELYLAVQERQARSNGSITLPSHVGIAGGGRRVPAFYLRAGLHRLKVMGLPGLRSYTDLSPLDTFRVKRVETSVTEGGVPVTRVELDAGEDLLEVIQARFSLATKLIT